MKTKLLTLGMRYLSDVISISDYLLSCYFKSLNSQSYIYSGNIKSLVWDLAKANNNINELQTRVQQSVESLFRPYFDVVAVSIVVKEDPIEVNSLTLGITIQVTDENKNYDIGYQLLLKNSIVQNVMKINNEALFV